MSGTNPFDRSIRDYAPVGVLAAAVCAVGLWALFTLRDVSGQSQIVEEFRWQKTSERGVFVVMLDAQSENIALREFLEWTVEITTATGVAVHPARFAISGGMPSHGHGLPSQPRVSRHLGSGKYLISGLKFNMAGDWVLLFDIVAESRTDRVSFDIRVDF